MTYWNGRIQNQADPADAQLVAKDYGRGNGPALAEMMQGIYEILDDIRRDAE